MEKEKLTELIALAAQHNDEAFAELYSTYYYTVYRYALSLCHREDFACDLLQETFLEAYRNLATLKKSSSFEPWLRRIVYSKLCNHHRKEKRYILFDSDSCMIEETNSYFLPEEKLQMDYVRHELYEMVNHLNTDIAEVIYLRYFEERSLKEIAGLCKIPVGTVKSRLNTGRQKLKKMECTL